MGLDPLYTPDQIERIQQQADPGAVPTGAVPPAPDGPVPVGTQPKKRNREKMTSIYWKHFTKGIRRADNSYDATCIYCGKVYPMGKQKGTGSLRNHINKSCKKVPHTVRHKPDALQRMLQAGSSTGTILLLLFINFLYILLLW